MKMDRALFGGWERRGKRLPRRGAVRTTGGRSSPPGRTSLVHTRNGPSNHVPAVRRPASRQERRHPVPPQSGPRLGTGTGRVKQREGSPTQDRPKRNPASQPRGRSAHVADTEAARGLTGRHRGGAWFASGEAKAGEQESWWSLREKGKRTWMRAAFMPKPGLTKVSIVVKVA